MSNAPVMPGVDALGELQNHFCLMNLGGELWVVDRKQVDRVKSGAQTGDISFYKKVHGELLMKRHLEAQPIQSDVKMTINHFWVNPDTHVYDSVAFSPTSKAPTTLNYWVGSLANPAPGDWSVIRTYLREVICDEDIALYNYLVQYIAHMLQHPEEKPGIVLVLLGRQGTGKGVFFQLLNSLWPKTTLLVSDVAQVLGQFNAALERHYVICMDEALFNGDKKSLERLKSLVTEKTCHVEQKYQPARTIESVHRFVAASNNEHFAHVDADDRRFLFIRVSSKQQNSRKFFSTLIAAIEDECTIGAMVYDLLRLDLRDFDVRMRPMTKEHGHQKLQSLAGFDRYWFEALVTGNLVSTSAIADQWSEPCFVSTDSLMVNYRDFDKNCGRYQPVQSQEIAAAIKKLCPSAKPDRQTVLHRAQRRGFALPEIGVARSEFEVAYKCHVDWDGTERPAPDDELEITDWASEAFWESDLFDCPTCQCLPHPLASAK